LQRIFSLLIIALFGIVLSACNTSIVDVLDVRPTITNPKYGDNDPHEWQGRTPWSYAVHGVDVSKFQGTINWAQAKRSGISFAFIKATEGGDLLDTRFKENWRGAKDVGMPRGAYHFYYFCRPAIEQVRWFIKHVPKTRGSMPPVLDMEWNSKSPTCRLRPPAEKVRSEMGIFLRELKRHYGKQPIVYTTIDFYRDNQLNRVKGVTYWLRSVAEHPDILYPGQNWKFWQYTGTGIVPGIKGNADINVFNGSVGQWQSWIEKASK